MIGLVLALIVVGIILAFVGLWPVGIILAVVAIVLFVLFLLGFGRRAAKSSQP